MKTLIAALIVAAAFAVPTAEASFEGVLTSGSDITVLGSYDAFLDTPTAAMTVVYVKGNKLEVAGTLTVATNTSPTEEITLPLPSPVDRVIIQVDLQRVPTSSFVVLVTQGGVVKCQRYAIGHDQLVFDVAP